MDRKQFDRPEHVVEGEIAKTKLSDEVVRAANLHLLAKEGANRVDRASNGLSLPNQLVEAFHIQRRIRQCTVHCRQIDKTRAPAQIGAPGYRQRVAIGIGYDDKSYQAYLGRGI